MFNLNTKQIVINLEQAVDLLAEVSEEVEPIEAGGCLGYQIDHPKYGKVVLIQTPSSDECMAFKL